jgi:outer membrane biosynthesis protein TonB
MNELLDLQLDEVSLVDSPANKSATVALFKRDDTMTDETKEELEKAKAPTEVETPEEDATDTTSEADEPPVPPKKKKPVAKSTREVELEAEVERLTKALEAKEDVAKADEMIDFGGEMIAKSSIPAAVLKKLEDVQKAQEVAELHKRAETDLPNFKGTVEQRGKLLKSIGADAELLALLKAADAAFKGLFQEIGKTDVDAGLLTADQKLDQLVKSHQEEKKVDFYKAYAAVIKTADGKKLLLETYKK